MPRKTWFTISPPTQFNLDNFIFLLLFFRRRRFVWCPSFAQKLCHQATFSWSAAERGGKRDKERESERERETESERVRERERERGEGERGEKRERERRESRKVFFDEKL